MTEDVNKQSTELILSQLKKHNGPIGNVSFEGIFRSHGLSADAYSDAKTHLLQNGKIRKCKGRGGAIALTDVVGDQSEDGRVESEATVSDVKELILKNVPKDGSSIGNIAIQTILKKKRVTQDQYWTARNELIVEGKLVKGRGMGGSISLAADPQVKPKPVRKEKYRKEKDLYQPFAKSVEEYWIKENNIDARRCVVEITANQGGKKTGGKWTRPDVTVVAVNTFRFVPGKTLDVITFEIKPSNDLDIVGVFETASHSRFAVKSYLAIHLPEGVTKSLEPSLESVKKECERFGVGLMYFKDPVDAGTWETVLEPSRKVPDPTETDNFLSVQITKKNQDDIHRML